MKISWEFVAFTALLTWGVCSADSKGNVGKISVAPALAGMMVEEPTFKITAQKAPMVENIKPIFATAVTKNGVASIRNPIIAKNPLAQHQVVKHDKMVMEESAPVVSAVPANSTEGLDMQRPARQLQRYRAQTQVYRFKNADDYEDDLEDDIAEERAVRRRKVVRRRSSKNKGNRLHRNQIVDNRKQTTHKNIGNQNAFKRKNVNNKVKTLRRKNTNFNNQAVRRGNSNVKRIRNGNQRMQSNNRVQNKKRIQANKRVQNKRRVKITKRKINQKNSKRKPNKPKKSNKQKNNNNKKNKNKLKRKKQNKNGSALNNAREDDNAASNQAEHSAIVADPEAVLLEQ